MECLIRRRYGLPSGEPLSFIALEDGIFTYTFSSTEGYGQQSIEYIKNNGASVSEDWEASKVVDINVQRGDKVMWYGNSFTLYWENMEHNGTYPRFSSTASFSITGNIMSLAKGRSFSVWNTLAGCSPFEELFKDCEKLINVDGLILPSEISTYNYPSGYMYLCRAYKSMFENCIGLITVNMSDIPSFGDSLCQRMFSGCTSLEVAHFSVGNPSSVVHTYSLEEMFNGCVSLEEPPSLNFSGFAYERSYIDNKGTVHRATLYPNYCLRKMFYGCEKLSKLDFLIHPSSIPSSVTSPFENWLYGTAKNTVGEINVGNTQVPSSWIPSNWTQKTN